MAPLMQNWVVKKPAAVSRGGIVAAQNGVAAGVGAEVLAAGGSAVDAVVAAAFALAVREPWNSGLGGIGFMVVQPPGGARAELVDFGRIGPAGLDTASYALTGETITELFTWPRVEGDRNMHGPLSFAIPSAVRGYALAVERFGRTPWRDLVAPAVALARAGLPVDWYVTLKTANAAEDLRRYDESRRMWLPDNLPPVCPSSGEPPALILGRLADTLSRLAEAGPDDFYQGEIAQAIAADSAAAGGVLSAADLAECCVGIAALTTTLLSSVGSRYVLPQTGILMNNGIMWFDPRPGRPNSMGPGKRALTNMCPLVAARDGRARFGVGASGGRRILASVVQMASFIIDFAMTPEEAAHQPRIDVSGDTGIAIDRRLAKAIRERLGPRRGAQLVEHTVWPQRFACPNLVMRGEDGLNYGISDVMSPWSAAVAEPGKEA